MGILRFGQVNCARHGRRSHLVRAVIHGGDELDVEKDMDIASPDGHCQSVEVSYYRADRRCSSCTRRIGDVLPQSSPLCRQENALRLGFQQTGSAD
jgi:hypothetical protein